MADQKTVEELFGNDWDCLESYDEDNNNKIIPRLYAPPDNDSEFAVLKKLLSEGRLAIMDKENMVVFDAANVVGYKTDDGKDGYVILSDR